MNHVPVPVITIVFLAMIDPNGTLIIETVKLSQHDVAFTRATSLGIPLEHRYHYNAKYSAYQTNFICTPYIVLLFLLQRVF